MWCIARRSVVAIAAASLLAFGVVLASQPSIQKTSIGPKMADDLYNVACTLDPKNSDNLVLTVDAVDPRGEPRRARIISGAYAEPPDDGVQDFFVVAEPSPAGQPVRTTYRVDYLWESFRRRAPWLRGVRVHSGPGPVVIKVEDLMRPHD